MLQDVIAAAEGADGAAEEKNELEELKQLLPDIREKVEDAKESQRTASAASQAIQQTLVSRCDRTIKSEKHLVIELFSLKWTLGSWLGDILYFPHLHTHLTLHRIHSMRQEKKVTTKNCICIISTLTLHSQPLLPSRHKIKTGRTDIMSLTAHISDSSTRPCIDGTVLLQ